MWNIASDAKACFSSKVEYRAVIRYLYLKGYCTVFQYALKSLENYRYCVILKNVANCKEKFQRVKKI